MHCWKRVAYTRNTAFQSLKPGLMEGSELKKEGGVGSANSKRVGVLKMDLRRGPKK